MLVEGKFHISYCTNIHPGQDWNTTFTSLESHLETIRRQVAQPGEPFGLGLRLSEQASRELGEGERLQRFRRWLQERDIYVFTMNGFPYGAFHGQRVKDRVHEPDWTTLERLEYTRRLFRQLDFLLPKGTEGGISTSPVSYRHWFAAGQEQADALRKGARQMAEVAALLVELGSRSGNYLHLDIEPEPDGLLENSADVLRFFRDFLLPEGVPVLAERLGLDGEAARIALLKHVTVCYDICHFALAFEEPGPVFRKFDEAGIRVGKIQVSAALRIQAGDDNREAVLDALKVFDEPVYLHQVTQQTPEGVRTWPDLPELFSDPPDFGELRAHFHVPVFTERFGLLGATQQEILDVLDHLRENPVCSHLEVETYTWDVLPPGLKADLAGSIARELLWLKKALTP